MMIQLPSSVAPAVGPEMLHRFSAAGTKGSLSIGPVNSLIYQVVRGRYPDQGLSDIENRAHRYLKHCRKIEAKKSGTSGKKNKLVLDYSEDEEEEDGDERSFLEAPRKVKEDIEDDSSGERDDSFAELFC